MKKRIIMSMELDEVSACRTPAQSLARATIAKSASPAPVAIHANHITAAGHAALAALVAAYNADPITKSETGNLSNMSQYQNLLKSFSDKHGVSRQEAHNRLIASDPEAIEAAYAADEQADAKRQREAEGRTSY
ncbi:hypothetical protein [Rhizobium leguminosarum]|uniref:hypothetical protein n=1 Tax=Rhizobium leguminosarum TaxID=384 RepID=UPI001AE797D7|nr:hypothetical protein [Rhizobium leguminosarum]MBP2444841.1 hypothetical protein [Rhizobium leguminosarum]